MQSAKCKVQSDTASRTHGLRPFAFCILHFALCIPVSAQTGFQTPPDTIKVQLSTANKEHKRQLSEYLEVPLVFALVGRESVAIEATLGEPGRFDIEMLYTKGAVELKNVRTEDGLGKADVVRKVQPMSPMELRDARDERLDELAGKAAVERIRKDVSDAKFEDMAQYLSQSGFGELRDKDEDRYRWLYARVRAFSGKADLLRKKLDEAAKANPRRFTTQEKESWKTMKFGELFAYYRMILQTEIAEEHLNKCGLDYDRSTRNAAEKVVPLFLALHQLMTGEPPESDDDKKAVKEAMTGGTVAVMKKALTADLRLRIYSDAGGGDPNAQWYNAQRVACRATGVGSIRVEGSLDPAKGDAADWWIIEKWEPGSIQFTTSTDGGVQFDPPKVEDGVAKLRVAAGEKAVRYWFEMRAERGGDLKVVVHESHIPAESKFPY
jgi:hypothetical protein